MWHSLIAQTTQPSPSNPISYLFSATGIALLTVGLTYPIGKWLSTIKYLKEIPLPVLAIVLDALITLVSYQSGYMTGTLFKLIDEGILQVLFATGTISFGVSNMGNSLKLTFGGRK